MNVKLLVEYYEVLTANDGPSVLVIAKDHIPDIILLDVMMPGMDGY
ncbi:MAG: response regulator [Alphaproteobacteria bacterium]